MRMHMSAHQQENACNHIWCSSRAVRRQANEQRRRSAIGRTVQSIEIMHYSVLTSSDIWPSITDKWASRPFQDRTSHRIFPTTVDGTGQRDFSEWGRASGDKQSIASRPNGREVIVTGRPVSFRHVRARTQLRTNAGMDDLDKN